MTISPTQSIFRNPNNLRIAALIIAFLIHTRLLLGSIDTLLNIRSGFLITIVTILFLSALTIRVQKITSSFKFIIGSLFAYLLVIIISFIINQPPAIGLSIDLAARVLFLILWSAAAITVMRTPIGLRLFGVFCRSAVIFSAVIALIQLTPAFQGQFTNPYTGDFRASGPFPHPVPFGMFAVTAFIGSEFVRLKSGYRFGILDAAALLSLLTCIALSGARTSIVILFVAYTTFLAFSIETKGRYLSITSAFALSAVSIFFLPAFRDVRDIFSLVFNLGEISTESYSFHLVESSMHWRIVNWVMSLSDSGSRWLTGLGPGHAEYYSRFGLTSHSLFMEAYLETGAIGLASIILLLFSIFDLLRKNSPHQTAGDRKAARLLRGLGLGLLFACTFSVTMIEQTQLLTIFLTLLGLNQISGRENQAWSAKSGS